MILGEKVKQLIESQGYSVNRMAKKIGAAPTYMYKIVKMESINTKYLEKISLVLKIPITAFFEDLEATNEQKNGLISQADKEKFGISDLEQIKFLNYAIEALKKLVEIKEEELEDAKYQLEEIMKFVGPGFEKLYPHFDKKELEKLKYRLLKHKLINPVVL